MAPYLGITSFAENLDDPNNNNDIDNTKTKVGCCMWYSPLKNLFVERAVEN